MKARIFITKGPIGGAITLSVRAQGAGLVGDLVEVVRPGGEAFGRTYAEWAAAEGPYVDMPPAAGDE